MPAVNHLPRPAVALRAVVPPTLLSALGVLGSSVGYLLFHTLVELFSIVIAMTALVVASTSRDFTRNHFIVYVAVAAGWCAGIDLLHTLAYRGMGLLPTDSANPATELWIAARFIQAFAMLSAPLFLHRAVSIGWLHAGFGGAALTAVLAIAVGVFPDAYIDGVGLTPFKIYTEYVIILMLLVTLVLLWRMRALMTPPLFQSITAAVAAMALSEFMFTRYVDVYANANMVGHLLKIFAYWFVYLGLVQTTLREPFGMLSRAASSYDAVPDPTLIVDADGRILQANRAAARQAGLSPAELVGRLSHPLFHDERVSPQDCPVCAPIAAGARTLVAEIEKRAGDVVECSVAPFEAAGIARAHVQVVRNISERRRMERERERLVTDLRERVKELRALYDISALSERADLDVPGLLAGVVARLPAAFLEPERVAVAIDGEWGRFGEPADTPADGAIERPILADGRRVGTLHVGFRTAPDDAAFLPEEADLLDTVATRLGESIARLQAVARVKRLTWLYEMLSATNRAIVRCEDVNELLQTLFEALQAHGAFPILFVALAEDGGLPLRVLHAQGIDDAARPGLNRLLVDPQGHFGQILPQLSAGRVIWKRLPEESADPWVDYLRERGILVRAVLPLLQNGRLLGLASLYTDSSVALDEEQTQLLNEMAMDMAFALDNLTLDERRRLAERQAFQSEHRFREVFAASPVPMLIISAASGAVRAVNDAHRRWLGYDDAELPDTDAWFERVYAEPELRQRIRALWPQSIETARATGRPVSSPELKLLGKDGSERICTGTVTVVGDDIVVAWTDLTEIRRQEQALRASEQRFRGMIEQTVTGIYVRLEDAFVYVNPRFCEITGWSREALLGHDVREFIPDPEAVALIDASWQDFKAGKQAAYVSVPFRCGNGEVIRLGLHATTTDWDGRLAVVVMVQDVTERERAEAQIRGYVKQLEGAMKSTLQAVSNMVELRDPYTAGHERRVGLIASAIACEMGWPQERCEALELIGLVHDIGKIAVPAEILSKPGRLTEIEMQIVRAHPEAGYQILKDIEFPAPVAEVIRQHHERMDGSGYPRGLTGEAIMPEARVLAVADVVESMAAHRPYRPALGLEAALAEIRRGSGSLYDPEVVAALDRLLHERGYSLPE